ncbi:putative leader peptide [Streptomyces paludis]
MVGRAGARRAAGMYRAGMFQGFFGRRHVDLLRVSSAMC